MLKMLAQDVTIFSTGEGLLHVRELAGGIEGEGDDDAVEDCANVAVHDAVVQAVEILPGRDGGGAVLVAAALAPTCSGVLSHPTSSCV